MSVVYGGFNVPFRKPQLIGRADAVEELHAALNQGEAAALTPALTGQGGIGKTQLAILYAYEKAAEYQGSVFWIDASEPARIVAQLAAFADRLKLGAGISGPPDEIQPRLAQLWIGEFGQRRDVLLIIDNVDNAELLDRNLPSLTSASLNAFQCKRVITSRLRDLPGCINVSVELLKDPKDRELLLRESGRVPTGVDDDKSLATICGLLGGLPLALRLAGGLLKKAKPISLPQFADRLVARGAQALTGQFMVEDYGKTLEVLLRESWDQLADGTQLKELLWVMGCLPMAQTVPITLLHKLLDLPAAPDTLFNPWDEAFEQLQNLNLLERPDETHARLHPLIHEYVKGQCDAELPQRLCLRAAQTLRSAEYWRTVGLDDLKQLVREELPLLNSIISNDNDTGKKLRTFEQCLRLQLPDLTKALDLHAQLFRQALLCGDVELAKTIEDGRPERDVAWLRQRWSTSQTHEALRTVLRGHKGGVTACVFSPNGRLLASASWDGTVRLWEVASDSAQAILRGHEGGVNGCAFSPDGLLLASACDDNTVRLWEVTSGGVRAVLRGHEDWVNGCAFSPNGQLLASASADKTVRLWEVANGTERAILCGHQSPVTACAFSLDDQLLASASDDGTVRLWEVANGTERAVLRGHESSVYACAFSLDGQFLASASRDGTVRLWEVASGGGSIILSGHKGYVNACAFNLGGQLLASASADKTVRLWEVASGTERAVLRGHKGYVYACAFSPDGQLLASASGDRTVRLWEVARGAARNILRGHKGRIYACAFSPDNQLLASASADKTVRLWKVARGARCAILRGHEDRVYACAFSPDNQLLASASGDETLLIWNMPHQSQLGMLQIGSAAVCCCHPYSPSVFAVGSRAGEIAVFDLIQPSQ